MDRLRSMLLIIPLAATVSVAAPFQDNDKTQNDKTSMSDKGATAAEQTENRSDKETTRDIRRAIVKDDSLSTMAHNVKVVTKNGMVTLRGPVRSEEEKKAVEAKAVEVAGASKVTNDLTVSPSAKTDGDAADRSKKKADQK
jgi:hyperosmotically inducible protein